MSGTDIEYPANGGKAHGYLARPPEGQGNGKGVLVLQEWWGLVPHIRDVTDRFARAGYVALAPDFWDGKQTTRPDEAGRMLMALNVDDAEKKLRGAIAALHEQGGVTGKVGAVGFCMGGKLALFAGSKNPEEIGAVVDFYGIHPHVHPDYARLQAPVLGIFGEKDGSVTPADAQALADSVRAGGGQMELHIYPGRTHAFFNDTRPEVYDAGDAADAWEKTLAFLAKSL
jgi:carboxymethylenebutenolidase